MKKLLVIGTLLIASVLVWASVIETFTVSAQGDQARLQWNSGIEGNLTKYKIERSENNLNYTMVTEINPMGSFSLYQYLDDTIMKSSSQRVYYYRIKMVYADGNFDYSETASVTLSFSGLQETWGSIKAMFR